MSEVAPESLAGEPTAGALLRQAREAAGLHVSTLAANLKVPVRKLEALEEDRYDLLPDAVFVRALASSVCRTLKMDPQPVLGRLPQTAQPRLAQDRDGINAPFRPPGDAPRSALRDHVSRPVAWIVGLLLLGTAVLVFLPVTQWDPEQRAAAANGADPVMPPGAPATVTAPPAEPGAEPGATAATPAVPASGPVAGSAVPPALPASAAALPAPAQPAAPASAAVAALPPASAASSPLAAVDGLVVFRTTGSSWIQVTDARGTPVLRRLMEAGETASATGAPPLAVTVGNMQATQVQVRGQPFNLGPVSRDNVARFEVK